MLKRWFAPLRSLAALMLLPGFNPASSPAGSLTGTVKDADGLAPLPGADVTVHVLIPDSIPFPTVTGPDGSYEITGIIPDNEIYVVIAWTSGYRQSYTRVADLGSQDLVFDILLEREPMVPPPPGEDSGNVAGTIFEVGAGGSLEGLPGATVTLHAGGGGATTSSGPDGSYSARIPAGSYAVTVSGTGIDTLSLTGLWVDSAGARVNAVVKKTLTDVGDGAPLTPAEYALVQNYPNPFNPATTIRYALPREDWVRLSVHDILGRQVAVLADGVRPAGVSTAFFDAGGLPGGMYFCRLIAGDYTAIRKMALMK